MLPLSRWTTTQSWGPSPLPTGAPLEKLPGLLSIPSPIRVHLPLIPRWQSHVMPPSRRMSRYFARRSTDTTKRFLSDVSKSRGKGNRRSLRLSSTDVIFRPMRCLSKPRRTVSTSGNSGTNIGLRGGSLPFGVTRQSYSS